MIHLYVIDQIQMIQKTNELRGYANAVLAVIDPIVERDVGEGMTKSNDLKNKSDDEMRVLIHIWII